MFFAFTLLASARVEDPEEVKDYINYVAQREGVNVTMALAIAKAESSFVANAKNPVGTASGVYQYVNQTFKDYCIDKYHLTNTMEDKNNPAIQINCAIYMLKEPRGFEHWFASFESWGKVLTT